MSLSQRFLLSLSVAALVGPFGASVVSLGAEECMQNDDVLLLPMKVRYANEIGGEFNALFCEANSDCLVELKQHREASVAIRAAWEGAKRVLLVTEDADAAARHREAVARFIGFVEGRLQIVIPRSWEESMRGAQAGAYRHIGFRGAAVPPTFSQELSVWLWPGLRVKVGNPCEFIVDSDVVSLNRTTFDKLRSSGEMVWRVFVVGAKYYVVVFAEMGNAPVVLRIDGSSGEVVWRAKAWGTGWVVWGGRGKHDYNVEIVESCGTVYLFGSGGAGGLIEGYDVNSGAAVLRFATTDWRQPDAKTEKAEEDVERRRKERESSTSN